jgi:hypothetical protein
LIGTRERGYHDVNPPNRLQNLHEACHNSSDVCADVSLLVAAKWNDGGDGLQRDKTIDAKNPSTFLKRSAYE